MFFFLKVMSSGHEMPPEMSRAHDLLSDLLNSGSGGVEDQVLSEMSISHTPGRGVSEEENDILIDVEVEGDEEEFDPAHDSQMVSQVLSDEDDGDDRDDHDITIRDHDDNQDDVSEDDDYDDDDQGDQEEMGEDDDEDDDEDEDDEEDDEGSDIDGENDDFQDIRNPFETDDLVFNMEDFSARVPNLPPG